MLLPRKIRNNRHLWHHSSHNEYRNIGRDSHWQIIHLIHSVRPPIDAFRSTLFASSWLLTHNTSGVIFVFSFHPQKLHAIIILATDWHQMHTNTFRILCHLRTTNVWLIICHCNGKCNKFIRKHRTVFDFVHHQLINVILNELHELWHIALMA